VLKVIDIMPMEINGEKYYTIRRFALITNKSAATIRNLTLKGNKIRVLKTIEIMDKLYIPASELIKYPFTIAGRANLEVYYYNKEGKVDRIITLEKKEKKSRSF